MKSVEGCVSPHIFLPASSTAFSLQLTHIGLKFSFAVVFNRHLLLQPSSNALFTLFLDTSVTTPRLLLLPGLVLAPPASSKRISLSPSNSNS
ncbi:unnamed protein product [Brassica rapa]|uniref:Uncharacterized protein n=2 Tax=Brassica TaxID=3705 RepID=A0A8D9HU66_BRACM|nr:unnamed protein product [Brassica napus]CAG7905102.1 unnamed protein product [Brassica rapa]